MLVLSRMVDESVVIDLEQFGLGLVVVTVVNVRGDKIRLGISADISIPVHRQEIWEQIDRERRRGEGGRR